MRSSVLQRSSLASSFPPPFAWQLYSLVRHHSRSTLAWEYDELDLRVQVHRRASSARHAGTYTTWCGAARTRPAPRASRFIQVRREWTAVRAHVHIAQRGANVAGVQVKQLFINITKRRYWRPYAAPGALPRRCAASKSSRRPMIMPYVKRIADAGWSSFENTWRISKRGDDLRTGRANGKDIHGATTALANFSRSSFCRGSGNFSSVGLFRTIVLISKSLHFIVHMLS